MRTNHYRKRLDHVRDGLFLPVGSNETMMFYTLFGVPDLDRAVLRARKIGASCVMFVPADGGPVQSASWDPPDDVTSGIAVAYEIAEPSGRDSNEPFSYATTEQLRQLLKDAEVEPSAFAGGKESVSMMCGGKVVLKVNVAPEDLP